MVLFALALVLLLAFLLDMKLRFVCMLVVFFAFFDMFDGFYKDEKIFAAIRYFVPLGLMLVYVFKYKTLHKADHILVLFVFYLVLLWVSNSGDFMIATRAVLALLITFLMIPIGRYIGRRVDFLAEFEGYNRFLLISIPLYIIVANITGFGDSYTDAFTTGFLITSRMYIVPIVVFLAIHYAITNKQKSWLVKSSDLAFIFINICILLINTRRTALGMLAGAILVYILLNRRLILKMVMLLVVVVAALIASYPLYQAKLTAQLERRERIQNMETYEEEGRYLETLYIIDYHEQTDKLSEFLFGVKLFDTYAFGNRYFGRDRPIHSDINMLFYSTGLVGSLLFAFFFIHYFIRGIGSISPANRKIYFPLLVMFGIILIPGRFIGTLTFAPFLLLLLLAVKFSRPRQPKPAIYREEEIEELETV